MRSHSSQVFTPNYNINGRLSITLDQNGVTTLGLHSPMSMPSYSMERFREELVSGRGPVRIDNLAKVKMF